MTALPWRSTRDRRHVVARFSCDTAARWLTGPLYISKWDTPYCRRYDLAIVSDYSWRWQGEAHKSPASPMREDILKAVRRVTVSMWPAVATIPMMMMGGADGMYLRAAGVPTYGIQGIFMDRDDFRAHGRDERMQVQSFLR